ncbi:hypothetical protein OG21DRAFT_1493077 [Imleria badia]|nr:hypothetical protein OG21DRAFT_1493077 [Imleria badia]
MSAPQNNEQPDFDFWDFVGCAVCHLPFSPADRGPPPVPFWITECGHVLCNSHLNPNQSCAKCGDQAIQLMPLQRNIDPPMSDWFRFLPHAIDSMANAVKFQQESLAALVAEKVGTLSDSPVLNKKIHSRDAEALRRELHLCRTRVTDQSREPSAHLNHNGKRFMAELRGQNSSVKSNSSPRSIPTPLGPFRLTLPPGEHPTFSRQDSSAQEYTADRPGSSRFAEQYAYHGEDNPRVRPSQPTDKKQSPSLRQPRLLDTNHGMMAPPPPPSRGKRSKPATGQVHSQADQRMEVSTAQNLGPQRIPNVSDSMGPPPTPQRPFSAALRMPSRVPTQNATPQTPSTMQTNRFIPSHGRTFSGLTPTVTSAGMTPAGNVAKASGGNRMPFMPQSSNGFG